jgi:hypothetical protein
MQYTDDTKCAPKKKFMLEIYRWINSASSSIGKITDAIKMSVIMEYAVNILQLSVKYQRHNAIRKSVGDILKN